VSLIEDLMFGSGKQRHQQ